MGPLSGVKVVEFAGIGPGPMGAMLLADLGASVLRIDRKVPADLGMKRPLRFNLLLRGRRSITLDLKRAESVDFALSLVSRADALIEGFRPGVMERLGLGPNVCLARNPRLVYGRMTGWGQDGPLAQAAGHDLNYIALAGALGVIGRRGAPPTPPQNLLGDFGGGALYLAFGLLAGIIHARASGEGQVVDAAIVDGTASLMTSLFGTFQAGLMTLERGTNSYDSGAPFYEVYECADGRWVSIAAIEGRFHAELLARLDIPPDAVGPQLDRSRWENARRLFAERFRTKPRDEWCALLEGTDTCFAPVLGLDEVGKHPHMASRQTLIDVDGVTQPAPAPRFSRSVPDLPLAPQPMTPDNTTAALEGWMSSSEIAAARQTGILD